MLILILLSAITLIVIFYVWQTGYWKRRGIPGPETPLFIGHYWRLMDKKYPGTLQLRDWTKTYGKVYGIQEGIKKILVVSDVDMLQEMFIKKFDYFYGRKNNALVGDVENDPRVHLFESQGTRWKRLRTICAPTFSSGSLKKITTIVEDTAIELTRLFDRVQENEAVDIYKYFQEYTMDVILRIAMGQQGCNLLNNPLSEFVQKIFTRNLRNPLFLLATIIPRFRIYFRKFFVAIAKLRKSPALPILKMVYNAIDERIAQREKDAQDGIEPGEPSDFVDLFLDARTEESVNDPTDFTKSNVKVIRSLTREEIVAQCFVFLLAGFDTTSNALSYTSWLLATNPEKQKKLLDEIDEHCIDEKLSKMKYLEACMKEALRMFPLAALAASRTCMKATTLGGIPIEEGTMVWADVWTLHYDKIMWGEDAADFVPERWMHDEVKHNMAWIPFGAGPRLCIGHRLAYIEEKLALIHILRRYSMERGPLTEKELRLTGSTTVQPEAVHIYLKRR